MASVCPSSWDEYLGGYVNLMPVLWLDNTFVDLLLGEPVSISPAQQGAQFEKRPQALQEQGNPSIDGTDFQKKKGAPGT